MPIDTPRIVVVREWIATSGVSESWNPASSAQIADTTNATVAIAIAFFMACFYRFSTSNATCFAYIFSVLLE
jgi:hypothetical protein